MLLLISGASGVGKSTARQRIHERLGDRVEAVELGDLALIPETVDLRWRQQTAEKAAQRARTLQHEDRHLLLAGDPVVPGEILATPSARHLDIAICLLDADQETQTMRLRERGDPEGLLPHHLAFADWLRHHARDPQHMLHVFTDDSWDRMQWGRLNDVHAGDPRWQISIIDTSVLNKDALAHGALQWATRALSGQEPIFQAGWHLIAEPSLSEPSGER